MVEAEAAPQEAPRPKGLVEEAPRSKRTHILSSKNKKKRLKKGPVLKTKLLFKKCHP